MATTRLSDVVIPEVYETYQSVNSPEKTTFVQSGIAVTNGLLSKELASGGETATIPYWKDLDADDEANLSTDDPDEKASLNKISTGKMLTRKGFYNQGYSAMDLSGELAGSDPMQRIKARFGTYWQRQFQRRIIATCNGLMAHNIANNDGDMVINIAKEAKSEYTDKTMFNAESFVDAVYTLGDMADELTTVAVHSGVMARMVKNDDIVYIPDSEGKLTIATYKGKRVIVDDSLPVFAGTTDGFKYTSVLFGGGAIGYALKTPKNGVAIVRDELAGNGGGMESIIERQNMIIHPFGYSCIGTPAKQSLSMAELAKATTWKRELDRKHVPLAFLVTN